AGSSRLPAGWIFYFLFLFSVLNSQSSEHFVISVLYVPHISSETVLIQLFMGLFIPQTAGIRGNLVGKDHLALIAAELDLKVYQVDSQASEILLHDLVDLERV